MQKKPVGESRIPTDYWAGLGFSRSMPASAIRERLNLSDSGYDGPKMTTPYEVCALPKYANITEQLIHNYLKMTEHCFLCVLSVC